MAARQPLLRIDSESFAQGFAQRPFSVRHSLVDHPLLTLDAIAELADDRGRL